jgi:hypothetical protein
MCRVCAAFWDLGITILLLSSAGCGGAAAVALVAITVAAPRRVLESCITRGRP